MAIDRKDFLKKVCFSGACFCGFSSIAFPTSATTTENTSLQAQDNQLSLVQEWVSELLQIVNVEVEKDLARKLIKKTAGAHYKELKMDSLLADYKGDLDKFVVFLNEKWGWKVDYDKEKKVLIADENKNFCVCPIAKFNKGIDSSAMCYCSEGFAEKMFASVSGKQTNAEVISSIRKGDASCIYKITFF